MSKTRMLFIKIVFKLLNKWAWKEPYENKGLLALDHKYKNFEIRIYMENSGQKQFGVTSYYASSHIVHRFLGLQNWIIRILTYRAWSYQMRIKEKQRGN